MRLVYDEITKFDCIITYRVEWCVCDLMIILPFISIWHYQRPPFFSGKSSNETSRYPQEQRDNKTNATKN